MGEIKKNSQVVMNDLGPPTPLGAYRSPRPSLQVEILLPCASVLGKIDGVQLSAWHLFLG